MRSPVSTECSACGFPDVIKGHTRVRFDAKRRVVSACEECNASLREEPDEDDPEIVRCLQVIVKVKMHQSSRGDWWAYKVALDRKDEDVPDAARAPKLFSLVGPVGDFNKGDVLLIMGRFTVSPKHGFGFEAACQGQLAILESEASLRSWLTRLPWVGDVRARELLGALGGKEGVLEALENNPEMLTVVDGITQERALQVKEAYEGEAGYRALRLFGAQVGIPEALMAQSIDLWESSALSVIKNNPYDMLDLERASFQKIDLSAQKMGLTRTDVRRCSAAVRYAIKLDTFDGHTYSIDADLKDTYSRASSARFLRETGLSSEEIDAGLSYLADDRVFQTELGKTIVFERAIWREGERIYLLPLYRAEQSIAQSIDRLLKAEHVRPVSYRREAWKDLTPASAQEKAVQTACESSVTIWTGGPGTGKSQSTRVLLDLFEGASLSVICCAPTGKAAIRMTELTGRPAQTIHRLIKFYSTSSDPLSIDADVVIVDESSMIDTLLADRLLSSIKTGTRVIFVGDVDQLPSVDAGQVLRDFIESERVPCVRFTQIFRQESAGLAKRIPQVAQEINGGEVPDLEVKGTNVNFLPYDDPTLLQETVVRAVTKWLPEKYGFEPEEIQVISPQKGDDSKFNWSIGVRALNMKLQEVLNPNLGTEMHIGDGYVMRPFDRVRQTKNDYDLQTMNGEQGVVTFIDPKGRIAGSDVITSFRSQKARANENCETCNGTGLEGSESCHSCQARSAKRERPDIVAIVDFVDRRVGYTKQELKNLQLAYCLTVHSMQGSSFRAIVMPSHTSHAFMLTRKLLYTGVTRAEDYVLLVGQASAISKAVKNTRDDRRRSSLREFIIGIQRAEKPK